MPHKYLRWVDTGGALKTVIDRKKTTVNMIPELLNDKNLVARLRPLWIIITCFMLLYSW